jgi:hypothetical protein
VESDREPPEEIEITPEMIEAGVLALTSSDLRFEGHAEIVQEVWCAMWRVASRKGFAK